MITKTSLRDKVSSKSILEKAGRNFFPNRSIIRPTRSIKNLKANQPVPGNNILTANLMVRTWNSATELQPSLLSLALPMPLLGSFLD